MGLIEIACFIHGIEDGLALLQEQLGLAGAFNLTNRARPQASSPQEPPPNRTE